MAKLASSELNSALAIGVSVALVRIRVKFNFEKFTFTQTFSRVNKRTVGYHFLRVGRRENKPTSGTLSRYAARCPVRAVETACCRTGNQDQLQPR